MNWSIIRNLGIAALIAYPAHSIGADQAPDVLRMHLHRDVTPLVVDGLLDDDGLRVGGQQPYEVLDQLADLRPPRF